MLTRRAGLTPSDLRAISELEGRVVDADGGRLKLEWGALSERTGDRVDDLLWWDADALVGFLGVYSFGGGVIELAGMVDPGARRRGIGGALLDAAADLVRARGASTALLVCPRTAGGGAAFAASRGGVPDHAEFAMRLSGEPTAGPRDPTIEVRSAVPGDADVVGDLLDSGFGHRPHDLALSGGSEDHLVIERDGGVIGYVRTTLDDGIGGIYGFVIARNLRGRGIGRDVLRRVCGRLREAGAAQIGLEVGCANEHALALYTSLGFEPVAVEEYFLLTFGPA